MALRILDVKLDIHFPNKVLREADAFPDAKFFVKVLIELLGVKRELALPVMGFIKGRGVREGFVHLTIGDRKVCLGPNMYNKDCIEKNVVYIPNPHEYYSTIAEDARKAAEELSTRLKAGQIGFVGVDIGQIIVRSGTTLVEYELKATCLGYRCTVVPRAVKGIIIPLYIVTQGEYVKIPYEKVLPKEIHFDFVSIDEVTKHDVEGFAIYPRSYTEVKNTYAKLTIRRNRAAYYILEYGVYTYGKYSGWKYLDLEPMDFYHDISETLKPEVVELRLDPLAPEPPYLTSGRKVIHVHKLRRNEWSKWVDYYIDKDIIGHIVVPSDYRGDKITLKIDWRLGGELIADGFINRIPHRFILESDVGKLEIKCKRFYLGYEAPYYAALRYKYIAETGFKRLTFGSWELDVSGSWFELNDASFVKLVAEAFDEKRGEWVKICEKLAVKPLKPPLIKIVEPVLPNEVNVDEWTDFSLVLHVENRDVREPWVKIELEEVKPRDAWVEMYVDGNYKAFRKVGDVVVVKYRGSYSPCSRIKVSGTVRPRGKARFVFRVTTGFEEEVTDEVKWIINAGVKPPSEYVEIVEARLTPEYIEITEDESADLTLRVVVDKAPQRPIVTHGKVYIDDKLWDYVTIVIDRGRTVVTKDLTISGLKIGTHHCYVKLNKYVFIT